MKTMVFGLVAVALSFGMSSTYAGSYENTTAKINTRIGELEFVGGFPTKDTVQKAYDQLDVQRATRAYLEFMPMMSVNSFFESHIRDYGWQTSSDLLLAEPRITNGGLV